MSDLPTKSSRVLDLLLYVGIGLAVLAGAAIYVVAAGGKASFPTRWFGLAVNTPLVFWLVIRGRREMWRLPTFWCAMIGLLLLHLAGFTLLLMKVDQWPLVWFVPSDIVEVLVLSVILSQLFPPWAGRPRPRHSAKQ